MRRATEPIVRSAGVTLIEMIVVISITGILVAMVSLFGRRQIEAYFDVGNRAALTDAADTALRRIGRDLQGALPNSVRVDPTGTFIEFVPVRFGGRYRADFTPTGGGNPLLFNITDTSFDVLGPPVTTAAGDQLVIYNLGQPGSSVYAAGTSSRPLVGPFGVGQTSLTFSGMPFPLESPQHRFQVVGGPVTYQCAPPLLLRNWCYNFTDPQPTAFGGLPPHPACTAVATSVLVDNVVACPFSYTAAALQRNGLVSMTLTLSARGETVTLMHQVDILNAP